MANGVFLTVAVLAFTLIYLLIALMARACLAYLKFRGSRVITCPEGTDLFVTATDLDVSIECSCPASIKVSGALTISARKLFEIVRLLPESDVYFKSLETEKPAAVKVDAKHLAIGVPIGARKLRLSECSRWPERRHCGQACLKQIEAAPEGCLVRAIASRWYQGKSCVLCRKSFGEIHWSDHKPALMDLNRNTVQWNEVAPEKLPEVLATHLPVCRNCHMAEWFRRRYPELVVERPSDLAHVRHKSS